MQMNWFDGRSSEWSSRMNRNTKKKASRRRNLWRSMEMLEDRALMTAIVWTNPTGGSWQTASNWDLNRLPAAGDDVSIPDLAGNQTITSSADVSVQTLNSAELLAISFGTLSVAQTAQLAGGLNELGGKLSV